MTFKLGRRSGPLMEKGQLKNKLSYKQEDASVPGTPVLRKKLDGGILGEANNDGSIFIHEDVIPGSDQEKEVVIHEMVHQTDMKVGKLAYNDNFIQWMGTKYKRKNGKIFYNNEWQDEGSKDFPWEKMPWE